MGLITNHPYVKSDIVPVLESLDIPLGFMLLGLGQFEKEGYWPKGYNGAKIDTKAYRTKNPGNVGNNDEKTNNTKYYPTVRDGVIAWVNYVQRILDGKSAVYNTLGGANITLEKYLGKYQTGNVTSYVSQVVSAFKRNGQTISGKTLLKSICSIGAEKKKPEQSQWKSFNTGIDWLDNFLNNIFYIPQL